MHIAFYSPSWPLQAAQNGIVTFTHWTRRGLQQLGHRVSVFTFNLGATDDVHDVYAIEEPRIVALRNRLARAVGLGGSGGSAACIAAALRAVHRRHPIDILEMEESFGWFAEVESRALIPVLPKLHGPAFLSLMSEERTHRDADRRIADEGASLRVARAISSPSVDTLERTNAYYGLTTPLQETVRNPVDTESDIPRWQRDRHGRQTIVFVGRFDRRKGADVLLRAAERLLVRYPSLSLTLVGPDRGVADASGERLHFEDYCARHVSPALRARLEFKGEMSNADIVHLRVGARVVVVPSRWESQGYTLIEAMLQGCPVVVSDAVGDPESVPDLKAGLRFRSEDDGDLAEKLAQLLDDVDLAARLGAAAREHVLEFHSAHRIAMQSLALYERVIDAAANRR